MRQQDIYIALDWLKPSLDELSDEIIGILSQLKSHSQILDVKEIVHQISGTLLLSELTSYHLLFEELEKYCDFIVNNKKNIEEANQILKSVTFFKIELHKFHASKKENKSLVFLKINEIRALMGLNPIMSENDNHVINHQQLIPPNINTQVKLDENNLQTLHLAWDKQIKNTGLAPKETLANLSKLADYLRLGFSNFEKKALWHVVFEWLSSLSLNLKEHDDNWLNKYSSALTELSVTFTEDEKSSHINELIHEFIFYLLSFDTLTEESRELVDKYNKNKLNTSSKVLDRVAFILENIESNISVDTAVDTIQLKESLELLDVTGWGIYSQQVNKILDAVSQNNGNADTQVIESLALLKSTIENTKSLFQDYEETEILSNAKDAAIREIRVNIENIKEIFNNYCLSKNTEDLLPVPSLFNNIDGTLKLVELPAVKKTLDQLMLVFQQVISADVPVLDWKEIDLIAEALTAIEYYFDKLVQHYNDESILSAADANITSAKTNIQNNIENPINLQSIQDRRKNLKPDVTHYDDSGELLPNTLKDEKELIVTDQNTNTTNDENNLQESMEVLMDNHSKEDTGFFDFSDDVKEQTKEPLNTKVEDDFVFDFDENISETNTQSISLGDIEDNKTSEDEFIFDDFDFENVAPTNAQQANVLEAIDVSDNDIQEDLTNVQLLAGIESNEHTTTNDDELLFDEFSDFQDISSINANDEETLFVDEEQAATATNELTGKAEYPLDNLKKLPDSDEIEKAELLLKTDDFDQDETIKEIYIEEADEVLEHIQKYLPIWQTNISDLQSLTEIRRAYHTLKGSGRMVGAFTAGEVAWAIENLLNRVIDKSIEPNEAILQLVNKTVDIFPHYIEDYANGRESRLNPIISIVQANNLIAKKLINSGLPALEQTVNSEVQHVDNSSTEVEPVSTNDINENNNEFTEVNSVYLSDELDAKIVSNEDLTLDDMSFDFEDVNTKTDKSAEINSLDNDISLFDASEQLLGTAPVISNDSNIINETDGLSETESVFSSDSESTNQENNSVSTGNKIEPELQEWIDLIEIPEDDNETDPDIQEIFNEEVEEVLELVNKRLIDLQVDRTDSSALADIRRGYHTLKGSGRMVGAKKLGEFAWNIEDMLNRVIDKSIRLDDDIIKILGAATSAVPDLVDGNFGSNHVPLMACAKSYSKNEGVGLKTSIALLTSSPVTEQDDINNDVISNQLVDDSSEIDNNQLVEDSSEVEIDELKVVFLEEADELVETIQDYVNNNPIGGAITNELIRALHTLRGSAAMSNIDVLHDLNMAMENLCRTYLAHEQDLETVHIDLLQALLDRTEHHINSYRNNQPVDYHSVDVTLVERIKNMQLSTDSDSENRRNHVSNYLDLGIDDLIDLEYEIAGVTESNKRAYFIKLEEQTDILYQNSKDEVVLNRLAKHLKKVYNILINNKDLQNHQKVEEHLVYTHQELVQIFDAIAASQIVENKPEVFNRLDTFKEWIRNQPESTSNNDELNRQEDTEFNFEEFSDNANPTEQPETNEEVANVALLDGSESMDLSDIDAALGFLNDDAEQQFLDKEQSKIFDDIEQKRSMQRMQQAETNAESTNIGSILDGLSAISHPTDEGIEESNENVTQNISALEEITLPVNNTISSLPIINKTIQLNTDEVLEQELSSLNDIDDAFSFDDEISANNQEIPNTKDGDIVGTEEALALNDSQKENVHDENISEFDFLLEKGESDTETQTADIEHDLDKEENVELIAKEDESFIEAEVPITIDETLETETSDIVQVGEADVDEKVEETELTEEILVSNDANQVKDTSSENIEDDEVDDIEEELLPIFTEEAQETVLEIEKEFSNWANDNSDLTALGALQRHLHTIKGGARMVGANKIGNLTHEAETVYEMLTNEKIVASPAIVKFMQHIQDVVAKQVDDLCTNPAQVQSAKPELNTISTFVNNLDETVLVNFFAADGSESNDENVEAIKQEETVKPVAIETVTNQEEAEELDSISDIVSNESVSKREPVKEITGVVNKMDLLTVPAKVIAVISPQEWNETDKPDEEMLEIFLEEAEEINETSSQLFHKWCQDVSDLEVLKTLQRELHTLKGGARMAGVASVGDLSHEMEFLYEDYALQKYQPVPSVGKLLSQSHDWLSEAIFVLKDGKNPGDANVLIEPLQEYRKSPNDFNVSNFVSNDDVSVNDAITGIKQVNQPEETSIVEAKNQSNDEKITNIKQESNAHDLSQESEQVTTSNFDAEGMKIEDLNITDEDNSTALTLPAMTGEFESDSEKKAGSNEVIRISSGLMEKLINLSGEAVINRGRIEVGNSNFLTTIEEMGATIQRLADQLRRMDLELEEQIHAQYEGEMIEDDDFDPLEMDQYSSLNQLSKSLSESASDLIDLKTTMVDRTRESDALLLQLSRIQSDLQDSLMNSRLVAFTKIVPRLQRIIRQTANELNKSVELKIENGDIELDRTILDKITSPLEHMLRNAVDHGVETPDERSNAGKQPKGTILLTLEREGGEIFVKVKDDGKGINAEAVKKKALDRGLINNPDLPDYEIHQLIFHAGLSTKQQVTQISGRGVGMDVVQSEIKQLGGTVFVDSEYGKGSQFTMRLPLTVAVSDALVVRSADKQYAIPLVQIERIERLSLIGIEQYIKSDEESIKIGDGAYALHYLNTLMDETSVFNSDVITTSSLPVIILKTASEKKQAIFVDELSGSRTEIVVKPLGEQFSKIQGVSAATIQGDGSVMLILDLPALIRNAPTTQKAVTPVQEAPKVSSDGKTHVMVIDDSVTVRKVTSRLLERNGLVAHTAKDGLDAIEKLQDFVPDIMLLDIEMPRMDGFEVATRVRKDMRLVNVPIIMITSRTGEKHRERAFEIGVNCYMGKPFQEKELLQNIDELINISIFDE